MSDYRIGRLNGRFVVTWWDGGRRRRYRLDALTAKDAEREAIDRIRRETISPGAATVATLWAAYRDDRTGRAVATTMKYTGIPILDHFGALRPDQVTTAHCRDYTAKRRAVGIQDGSIYTELGHLRTALTWAVKARLVTQAPAIDRPQKPAPKERYLTGAEIDKLLAAKCEPHIRLAIILMLTTAGRVGAVLDLTWDRVDFERGRVNLRSSATGPRKGRAIVPMNGTLRAALTSAHEAALSDYVVEWNGGPVKSIRNGFTAAVLSAKLKDVTPHCLRHTAGVHLIEGGMPMEAVSQMLGHSNVTVTRNVYARFSPDYLREGAEILDFGKLKVVK